MGNHVVSVSQSAEHSFSKKPLRSCVLVEGLGVQGDAHAGETVQHLSRVQADPTQPNLRQVHLIHAELFDELGAEGFSVRPGDLGENITTRGVDLLSLPEGTVLHIGETAVVQVTGLRTPCFQIDRFQSGLLKAVLPRDSEGNVVRKAGVMGIVCAGGEVSVGDGIRVEFPAEPHRALERV
ncbi:MOSC domain-containing protein [Nesterenkonia sp. E16_7]|uniref:MOSC domain-containing protein n=1 Tax=unclassified Nesterenkonia TaxID=2629769 RepID=UPI001A9265F7|nr:MULTISPECIES: MOSC domain-containing protein [unclassified Nesterenkonia]MBO0594838.1 MOSC domain-containing protein [Nesterenkonia sp. E16_10]MBO0597087.1 MOSC domain-containing protein [Nesterenkonia sp. E16_7]